MRSVLCGCPDPVYIRYGNKDYQNRHRALLNYIKSKEFKEECKKDQGCVISRQELRGEMRLLPKISDKTVQKEMRVFYNQIMVALKDFKRISVVSRPSKKHSLSFKEILIHEFVHILLEENKIRPKSWKWNEGLVTYLTRYALGIHHVFERKAPLTESKMWNIYAIYTHKWAKLFRNIRSPQERVKVIHITLKRINTPKKP